MIKKVNFVKLEKRLGYKFKDELYALIALMHSSYANEVRKNSNERFEFLGDSVLNVIVSEYLFYKFPDLSEGKLTKLRSSLVCEKMLFSFSKTLGLDEFLMVSYGEKLSGGNKLPSVLADTFEAIVAAIYLDSGIKEAKKFILRFILPALKSSNFDVCTDYKTTLQEFVQQRQFCDLFYSDAGEIGPDHKKIFFVEAKIKGRTKSIIIGKGKGKSKKEAQQFAAKEALELLRADSKILKEV